jgi:endonuclease/exonuclease/phosphatase family metal-dependent hydrolase
MHDATQPVEGEPSGTWFRTGVYVIFDNAKWQAVGAPGTFDVGQIPNSTAHRFAAFVMLRNRVSGAQFLFVSPHLYVNSGSQGDQTRQQETATMIAKARQLANGLPIVYAGDTNSQELHPLDGPVVAARSVHVADAIWTAQGYDNRTWNSANQYYRSLSKWQFGRSIDKVFAEPGVGVVRWGVYANVVSGQISGTIPSDHNPVYADLTLPY